MQSRELYKKIVFDLILEYRIKVKRWRTSNIGYAYCENWEIEIPKPVSLAKFLTCLHEIGHLVKDKVSNPLWKSEYLATKYAFDTCEKLNIPITEYERLNNLNYLVSCIADDIYDNDMDIKKIDKTVMEYAGIDIKLWKNKVKKGLVPKIKSIRTAEGCTFYKIKIDWVKKKVS